MSAFAMLPQVIVSMLLGLIGEQGALNTVMRPENPGSDLSTFVSYKQAVQSYVSANAGYTGTVPASLLSSSAGAQSSGYGNTVIRNDTGTQIVTWAPGNGLALNDALAASEGDRAIGISTGTRWQTPLGGDMGPLPFAIPSGDLVSVVLFIGTGF